ncbi:MAG: DMT family transporter [Firmicutes bacterium]|nr:DMT family transporter [Bacillota bacterium]
MNKLINRMSGTAAVLIAAVLWSLSPFFVKLVTIDPMLLPCCRNLMAGLILLPFARRQDIRVEPRLFLLLVPFSCISLLYVMASRYTAAANASALYYTSPLWIFVFTCVAARRLQHRSLPSVLLLVAGIIVIVLEPKTGTNQFGNFMGILAGVAFACFAVNYNAVPYPKRISYLCLANLFSCPFILLVILILQPAAVKEIGGFTAWVWFMLLVMAVTQQVIPYFLYGVGLAKLPIFRVSMLALGEFILAPVWTLLFLADRPTIFGFVGWLLVLGGLLLNLLLDKDTEKPVPTGAGE